MCLFELTFFAIETLFIFYNYILNDFRTTIQCTNSNLSHRANCGHVGQSFFETDLLNEANNYNLPRLRPCPPIIGDITRVLTYSITVFFQIMYKQLCVYSNTVYRPT